jgi:hypothetical protein
LDENKVQGWKTERTYNCECVAGNDPDSHHHYVRVEWDWGNEKTKTREVPCGSKAEATHSWSKPGTYRVRARTVTSDNLKSGWTDPITVTVSDKNFKPVIEVHVAKSRENPLLIEVLEKSRDPDGYLKERTIDFGDGTSDRHISPGEWKTSKKYEKPGTYTLTVTATDNDDETSRGSFEIQIEGEQEQTRRPGFWARLLERIKNRRRQS